MQVGGVCANVLTGPVGPVFVVRYDGRGEYCMGAGQDRRVYLWNPRRTGAESLVQAYAGHSWEIYDLAIGAGSQVFATCGGERQAFLWDAGSGRVVRRFHGHHLKVNAVAFNEDASVLASGSDDRTVRLWDCRSSSRHPVQVLEDAQDSVSSIDIRGACIGVGALDGRVRRYDVRRGGVVVDGQGGAAVTCVRLGLDEQCYLVSTADSTVRLRDGPGDATLNTFTGHCHRASRTECAFLDNEAFVVSGSEDGCALVWDVVSAGVVLRLSGHAGPVTSVACHPSGTGVLTASTDGTVRVWR